MAQNPVRGLCVVQVARGLYTAIFPHTLPWYSLPIWPRSLAFHILTWSPLGAGMLTCHKSSSILGRNTVARRVSNFHFKPGVSAEISVWEEPRRTETSLQLPNSVDPVHPPSRELWTGGSSCPLVTEYWVSTEEAERMTSAIMCVIGFWLTTKTNSPPQRTANCNVPRDLCAYICRSETRPIKFLSIS